MLRTVRWASLFTIAAVVVSATQARADQMDDDLAAGKVLLVAGKSDDAATKLTVLQAQAQVLVDANARDHHALYILGSASMLLGDDAVAAAALNRATKIQPDNLRYVMARAQLADMQDKPADAASFYQKALAIDPKSLEAWTQLGLEQRRSGQFAEAEVSFEKGAALAPKDPKFPGMIAQMLEDQHKNDDALAMYQKAIDLDSKYGAAYSGRGQVFEAKGENAEALAAYTKAVELSPDDFRLIAKQVQLNEALGKPKERDAARERVMTLQKAGKVDAASFCRQVFPSGASTVMAFEYFDPKPGGVRYAFNILSADGKRVERRISSTAVEQNAGGVSGCHLDAYSTSTHELLAKYDKEPTYEQARDAAMQYLAGKLKPISAEPMPVAGDSK